MTYERWAFCEAAIEALSGKTHLDGAKMPMVVKFADAKAEGGPGHMGGMNMAMAGMSMNGAAAGKRGSGANVDPSGAGGGRKQFGGMGGGFNAYGMPGGFDMNAMAAMVSRPMMQLGVEGWPSPLNMLQQDTLQCLGGCIFWVGE